MKKFLLSFLLIILFSGCSTVNNIETEDCLSLRIECSKNTTDIGVTKCLTDISLVSSCKKLEKEEYQKKENEILKLYPQEATDRCKKELGIGFKPWRNKHGIFLCGCRNGYISDFNYKENKKYCKKEGNPEKFCDIKWDKSYIYDEETGGCSCPDGYGDEGGGKCLKINYNLYK